LQPELQYNIALCFYKTKQLGQALKHIAEIIERGVRDHPELSVGRWVPLLQRGFGSTGNAKTSLQSDRRLIIRQKWTTLGQSLVDVIGVGSLQRQETEAKCWPCAVSLLWEACRRQRPHG